MSDEMTFNLEDMEIEDFGDCYILWSQKTGGLPVWKEYQPKLCKAIEDELQRQAAGRTQRKQKD